ncbi:UNVERIFIED_CONTAM: hypothetical protein GTU68_010662 [Idotea baltica]|nr:hypothetical protein [Idotea baltica]
MKDKIVFITGAAGGIGFEIARRFALEGAHVVLTDLEQSLVNNAVSRLASQSLIVHGLTCNVTIEDDVNSAIDTTIAKFGTVDVLINNAGLQYVSQVEDFPAEKFDLLIRVMLTGSFLTTKKVFSIMKEKQFGRILNMASINGLVGFAGKAAYNSAKHGVIGLTKVTALEGAPHGVTVNAICPGYVDTPLVRNQLASIAADRNVPMDRVLEEVIFPLVPQKRLLTVDEIANYALFLATDSARGITGQAVVIDGGYTAQ